MNDPVPVLLREMAKKLLSGKNAPGTRAASANETVEMGEPNE